mmetsp:Transcript_68234/g.137248  ORF Transcript_68234/g.137248 Transcript_68234/m.137248 type:complete len:249 (+) Transcript_68234:61-807(+)
MAQYDQLATDDEPLADPHPDPPDSPNTVVETPAISSDQEEETRDGSQAKPVTRGSEEFERSNSLLTSAERLRDYYRHQVAKLTEILDNTTAPPTNAQVGIHLVNLMFTIYVWRGIWMWEDWLMEDIVSRRLMGLSAFLSMSLGGGFLVAIRRYRVMRDILPVSAGESFCDKLGRLLFLFVAIAAISNFWRGLWLFADDVVVIFHGRDAVGTPVDFVACALVGFTGLAIVNLTPLSQFLLMDGTATAGG